MNELRLYLRPDSLREGRDCAWTQRDARGHVVAGGTTLADAPRSGRCHLVLAAELVNVFSAPLPDLPPRRLAPLLPAAAEPHSLSDAEQLHVAWLGRGPDGRSWLATLDRAWLAQTLELLRARGLEAIAALPESLLLPLEDNGWSVLWNQDGAVARLDPVQGLALDREQPPAGLRLALAGGRPRRVRVFQGNALHAADVAAWGAALGVEVQGAGTWDWREAAWRESANLLQGRFQPHHDRPDWPRHGRRLAWGLGLLAGIQMLGVGLDWAMLAREQTAIDAELQRLATRALPAGATVVDPAWQVGERLRTLQTARGGGDGFSGLIDRVGQVWPAAAPPPRAVEYRDGSLTLTLEAAPGAWQTSFTAALAGAGLALQESRDGNGQSQFTIRPRGATPGDAHER